MKVCIGPSGGMRCPTAALIPRGKTRCPDCARAHDRARGSRQARGYGAAHFAERKRWLPLVAMGNVKCWRCGEYIAAGAPFDLGHDDQDRARYRGPEHVRCNRATAGRR